MEDKRLTEKISAASATDDALIHIVEPGNVSQHPTGSSFKAKAKDVVNSFQNNIPYYKYLTFVGLGPLTTAEVVSKLNFTGMFGNFVITEIDTPVLISGLKTDGSSLLRHMYIFTGGKGIYGSGEGQTLVTEDHLIKISTFPATIQDIPNDSNTQTIPLGELPDGNYLAAANSEERDFTNEDIVYFFSYVQGGVEYRVLFNGTPGVYGGEGNPQFTGSDLIPSTNSNVLPTIPTWEETLEQNNQSSVAPIVFDPVTEEKTTYAGTGMIHQNGDIVSTDEWEGDTAATKWQRPTRNGGVWNYMAKEDIQENLPDFFLVTSISPLIFPEVEGAKIGYITDTLRPLSLEPYAPQINNNTMSVDVIGNDIFIAYNATEVIEGVSKRRFGILKLTTYLQGNDLRVKEFQDLYIPASVISYEAPYPTMHGEDRNEDYLFYSIASDPTVILKINRHNILDYRVSEPLFISGSLHDIQVVEDYIYMYRDMEDNTGVFYRINENLNIDTLEELFTIGGDDFSNIAQDVFCISRNKIYVCVRNTSSTIAQAENLGIQVYSLTGRLLRENMNIPIATGQTTGYPYPHWMDIHNDKIILHTCQPGSNVRVVARIDTQTLELDGDNSIVVSPCGSLTDDNTVTPKGEVYLNSERDSSFPLERRLYYIPDYRDLSAMVEYSGMDYFSGGSTPGTTRKKTGLITRVSELEFDIPIPPAEPELATGNTVSFEALQVYNIDTPATGDILFDFTDAKRIQQKFYHNDSEAPDIPAEGVLMGTGTYVTGVLNVIIFEFVKTGRVEYWIIQEG